MAYAPSNRAVVDKIDADRRSVANLGNLGAVPTLKLVTAQELRGGFDEALQTHLNTFVGADVVSRLKVHAEWPYYSNIFTKPQTRTGEKTVKGGYLDVNASQGGWYAIRDGSAVKWLPVKAKWKELTQKSIDDFKNVILNGGDWPEAPSNLKAGQNADKAIVGPIISQELAKQESFITLFNPKIQDAILGRVVKRINDTIKGNWWIQSWGLS